MGIGMVWFLGTGSLGIYGIVGGEWVYWHRVGLATPISV
jgi:hypothetical protein